MSDKTEYDLQREARIQRNKAMLASLQVQDSADKVAEPQRAAQAKEAAVKAAARQKYVHSGPARKSSRAGAQRTKAKLQAQAGEDSEEEHASASSQSYGSDADSKANDGDMTSRKRRRSTQEAEFDPADSAEGSDGSSDSEGDESDGLLEDSSPAASLQNAADKALVEQDEEELQLQQALAMSLQAASGVQPRAAAERSKQQNKTAKKRQLPVGPANETQAKAQPKGQRKAERKGRKPKSNAGIQNPTAQEMEAAFALLNPSGGSVISTHDILQAGVAFGYNFDEDEVVAMMELAASVTERASLSSMTFQGFQKLVEHYSQTA